MGDYSILGERVKERKKKKEKGTYISQMGKGLDLPKHNGSIHIPEKYPTSNLGRRKNERKIIGRKKRDKHQKGRWARGQQEQEWGTAMEGGIGERRQ